MDMKQNNLVHPLLQWAKHVDSQPLGHPDDSGPGLRGPVHGQVGDGSLRKGLLFTEHFRGKPCRIHKTGYNVEMILGIDGGVYFRCPYSDGQSYKEQIFPSPLGNIIHRAIFLSPKTNS